MFLMYAILAGIVIGTLTGKLAPWVTIGCVVGLLAPAILGFNRNKKPDA